jgi:hypothetical protein
MEGQLPQAVASWLHVLAVPGSEPACLLLMGGHMAVEVRVGVVLQLGLGKGSRTATALGRR